MGSALPCFVVVGEESKSTRLTLLAVAMGSGRTRTQTDVTVGTLYDLKSSNELSVDGVWASYTSLDDLFIVVGFERDFEDPLEARDVSQKVAAFVRSLGSSSSLQKRWLELYTGLERFVDGSTDSKSPAGQWENFLASARLDAERQAGELFGTTTSAASAVPPKASPRASPRVSPRGSPRASPRGSPRISPRPKVPSVSPLTLPKCPESPLAPDLSLSIWALGLMSRDDNCHRLRLVERPHHYSVVKEMRSFFVVGSVEWGPPTLGANYPLHLEFVLTNADFSDEIHLNPNLKIACVDKSTGKYSCTLASDPGGSVEVLRFLAFKSFPENRIPLRIVLTAKDSTRTEFVYEMNPIVDGIEKLVVELWSEETLERDSILAIKSSKTNETFAHEIDTHNQVIRLTVHNVSREKRRDKIEILGKCSLKIKSCSMGFECRRKLLTQMTVEATDDDDNVQVMTPILMARDYFAQ